MFPEAEKIVMRRKVIGIFDNPMVRSYVWRLSMAEVSGIGRADLWCAGLRC